MIILMSLPVRYLRDIGFICEIFVGVLFAKYRIKQCLNCAACFFDTITIIATLNRNPVSATIFPDKEKADRSE